MLHKRIGSARRRAGLSQAHLAKLLGISQPAVSKIESGRVPVTSDRLELLARVLRTSVAYLIGEKARA